MSSSTQLVDKVSGLLSTRFSRRGFFARSAVVGSAIAANPVTYALTPTKAYAAVCSCSGSNCDCGSTCCDGYTEFCCTMTGRNQCPPGSLLGGWWKVDGSGFCNGPRYYMDCNSPCNGCGCGGNGICSGACSGTGCGCALGDCGNRKAGCTNFRYGQCNQQISCIGPIICRVVTCIAPWEVDGTCTTTARFDAATAFHDRPCLHGQEGSLDVAEEVGGGIRVAGWIVDGDTNAPVDVQVTVDGQVVARVSANVARPDIAAMYPGQGQAHGFDTVVPAGGGSHTVCVAGIAAGPGPGTILGCRTVVSSGPFGSVDAITVGKGNVTVEGWAVDPDTNSPIEVHVYVSGRGTPVLANIPRPDVAASVGKGPNHGYRVTVAADPGVQTVEVYAINVGPGGNTLLARRTVEIGSPFGFLDSVVPAPGGVRVQGWAIDPDTPNPIQVHAYIAGKGTAIVANIPRPDVGTTYGNGANHGFQADLPAPPGRQDLVLYAINDNGPNKIIATRSVDVLSGSPFGSIDGVEAGPGSIRVAGWVLDPETAGPIEVHVYVDSSGTPLVANVPRPDVAAMFPGYGAVRGFDARIPVSAGFRQVCIYAINVGPGENRQIGCRMVLVGGDPYGMLDVVRASGGQLEVAGWAIDPDVAGPIEVHVYVDGVGRVVNADIPRSDIAAAYPTYGGAHGFRTLVPVAPGRHQVCVYAIDVGPGENRLLACRTVDA